MCVGAWPFDHINIDGTANVLKACDFSSSGHQPRVEQMPRMGRRALRSFSVEMSTTGVQRLFALPVLPTGYADRVVQVVHSDDAQQLLVRALLDTVITTAALLIAALAS